MIFNIFFVPLYLLYIYNKLEPMPRISAFSIAQEDIEAHFNELAKSGDSIFQLVDMERIFEQSRKFWRLPKSWHVYKFIEALEKKIPNKFLAAEIEFPNRTYTRYIWGETFSLFDVALSLNPKVYLSHYTALYMHGLTDQIPKDVYATLEQPKKIIKSTLTQEGIHKAFSKEQRTSKNKFTFEDKSKAIYLLNGAYSGNLGVLNMGENKNQRVTNIERTLIDIAVRPVYSGGVYEVLEAYKRALKKDISVNKMVAMLRQMNFIYPYHQTIGFYMQRAGGFSKIQLEILKRFEFEYDFYLTYNMKDKEYSEDWKLYYPKGF